MKLDSMVVVVVGIDKNCDVVYIRLLIFYLLAIDYSNARRSRYMIKPGWFSDG